MAATKETYRSSMCPPTQKTSADSEHPTRPTRRGEVEGRQAGVEPALTRSPASGTESKDSRSFPCRQFSERISSTCIWRTGRASIAPRLPLAPGTRKRGRCGQRGDRERHSTNSTSSVRLTCFPHKKDEQVMQIVSISGGQSPSESTSAWFRKPAGTRPGAAGGRHFAP